MKNFSRATVRFVALVPLFVGVLFFASSSSVHAAVSGGYCTTGVPGSLIGGSKNVTDVIKYVTCFIEESIVPFLIAMSIVVFMYGMVKFIGTQETSEREAGKQFMLWGIIALAVMFSVWGITRIVGATFGIHTVLPLLPTD